MILGASLAPLAALRRFVTYETFADPDRPGKTIKRPTDVRTSLYCNSNLAEHQYTFDDANATGRPVGFVFVEDDPYFFIDIDAGLIDTPQGPQWSPLAHEILQTFPGAAVEVSQSGTGLHIIGRGKVPPHSKKNIPLHIELYTHERFCALTGNSLTGDCSIDFTPSVTNFAERYFPPNSYGEIAGWSGEAMPEWDGHIDDAELIKHAISASGKTAAGAFGAGAHVTFADLWHAEPDPLTRKWPGDKGGYDASQADAALAGHLAFWTGKNNERTRELMYASELRRAKWDDRPEWLETTIQRAAAVVKNVHQKRKPLPAPGLMAGVPVPPPPKGQDIPAEPATLAPEPLTGQPAAMVTASAAMSLRVAGREFINAVEQPSYFAGCVYVTRENKIWIPSSGHMLDKARFDVVYAGHIFTLDNQNEKTTDSPFDAFTKSRVLEAPRAWKTCFRPEFTPGAIAVEESQSLLNTYLPIQTLRRAGDATPFLRHMEKLFPVKHDRDIVMHFMASMAQNPGVKPQWCPVIIGAEGNGKSFLNRIAQHNVGRRYSHLVNPTAMEKTGNQFNSWILQKLFVGIEEIKVSERRDFLETFKTTVTDDWVPIEGKGADQETGDNRVWLLMFSNHLDAVPTTVDTRRYSIFYTAQQTYAEIIRDGMTGTYFPELYDWFYGRGRFAEHGAWYGASVINDYLRKMPLIAELDPAQLAQRAPETSSTVLARSLSLGRAEQEIVEAIAEGRAGFGGGWVSSIMLDRLLDAIRAPVPRNKRKAMIEALGYMLHPHLPDGRVHNLVTPDNGKPRLYVKAAHMALALEEPAKIAAAYTRAQHQNSDAEAAARFGAK